MLSVDFDAKYNFPVVVDIKKGEACGSSITASSSHCAKGLTCGYCPNDSNKYLCMDGKSLC